MEQAVTLSSLESKQDQDGYSYRPFPLLILAGITKTHVDKHGHISVWRVLITFAAIHVHMLAWKHWCFASFVKESIHVCHVPNLVTVHGRTECHQNKTSEFLLWNYDLGTDHPDVQVHGLAFPSFKHSQTFWLLKLASLTLKLRIRGDEG